MSLDNFSLSIKSYFIKLLKVNSSKNQVTVDNITITFQGAIELECKTYLCAFGYNNRLKADKISVSFKNKLQTEIKIKNK